MVTKFCMVILLDKMLTVIAITTRLLNILPVAIKYNMQKKKKNFWVEGEIKVSGLKRIKVSGIKLSGMQEIKNLN